MPVYAIVKYNTSNSGISQEKYNLEDFSFFARGTIKDIIRAMVRTVSERSKTKEDLYEIREKLNDKQNIKIFTQKKAVDRIIIITDEDYSSLIAQKLMMDCFKSENYDSLIQEYKNWEQKDIMKQIESELEKCNMIVVEGLSQILERGESLSELVEKSETLNAQTKILFKTAKKKNSCC